MAFRYAKHQPGDDYGTVAMIGVGGNDTYPKITVTLLDIANYIQNRDRSIRWNVTVGEYMEIWVNYPRLGFDALAASEILSQGVSNGLKGSAQVFGSNRPSARQWSLMDNSIVGPFLGSLGHADPTIIRSCVTAPCLR